MFVSSHYSHNWAQLIWHIYIYIFFLEIIIQNKNNNLNRLNKSLYYNRNILKINDINGTFISNFIQ